MIYLASPYSGNEAERYEATLRAAAHLTKLGMLVYSPIVHYHGMALKYDLPKDFTFWKSANLAMIDLAEEVIVLRIEGWNHSVGVQAEMLYAQERGLPVVFMDPVDG